MALEKTTISRTSASAASYITTHGVARCLKDELKLKLKDKQLSLNRKQERESIKRKKVLVMVERLGGRESRCSDGTKLSCFMMKNDLCHWQSIKLHIRLHICNA